MWQLLALPAVVGLSAARHLPARQEMYAGEVEKEASLDMEQINLDPRYSTKEIPGKCIKCLAEQELNGCLMELLREEGENKPIEQRFETLVSFLKSPEAKKLRDETEKYLSEGKDVRVKVYSEAGKMKYHIDVGGSNTKEETK